MGIFPCATGARRQPPTWIGPALLRVHAGSEQCSQETRQALLAINGEIAQNCCVLRKSLQGLVVENPLKIFYKNAFLMGSDAHLKKSREKLAAAVRWRMASGISMNAVLKTSYRSNRAHLYQVVKFNPFRNIFLAGAL